MALNSFQIFVKEGDRLVEAVHRLFLTVHGFVIIPESMTGSVIAMELIVFAACLQTIFENIDICRGRTEVIVAKDA